MEEPNLIAGIEAGGTKYVCALAKSPTEILEETRFPTGEPEATLDQVLAFFREASEKHGTFNALGIGTFGPADVNPRSPGYGQILTTPKLNWTGFHLVNYLRERFEHPVTICFDTDVNAAAIGEAEHGAGRNFRNIAYVTIGTGIGGGLLLDGHPVHGRMHPEIGHLAVPDFDYEFEKNTNICPFHASCLEGRACGPAIEQRWGASGDDLADDHPAWRLEAKYLAAGCIDLTAAWSPDMIIIGGGVIQREILIGKIREEFAGMAGEYWSLPPLDSYLQTPGLGQQAGIVGALTMAQRSLGEG